MAGPDDSWLPIFPLELVLLPGTLLPLHIFEPRYRRMVRRCLDEALPFCVVLVRENKLAAVACEARILRVLREYPDGRLDILTRGGGRQTLLELREHRDGYLEGRTAEIEDEPEEEDQEAREFLQRLVADYRRLAEDEESPASVLGAVVPSPGQASRKEEAQSGDSQAPAGPAGGENAAAQPSSEDADPGASYTFFVAAQMPMEAADRQALLETVSEHRREQVLSGQLVRLIPQLKRQAENRRKVRGNGKLSRQDAGGANPHG